MASIPAHHAVPNRSLKERVVAAIMLQHLLTAKDVRVPKVRRLRSAIRKNKYENDLKQQVAIDRLLGEMAASQALDRLTP